MAFSHRMATLAAVVAIPLGIAATSYALTDSPEPPRAPSKVELDGGGPEPAGGGTPHPSSPSPSPSPAAPGGEVVPRPPATDGPRATDDDTGGHDDRDETDDRDDSEQPDDGAGAGDDN
ncbi:MAG TPA: small secreted hydrophilic protein [Streptomyces sp.]|nr:small secreted hydrophilic protein [Streptomyces sp.]